jgi:hypothetical protein
VSNWREALRVVEALPGLTMLLDGLQQILPFVTAATCATIAHSARCRVMHLVATGSVEFDSEHCLRNAPRAPARPTMPEEGNEYNVK